MSLLREYVRFRSFRDEVFPDRVLAHSRVLCDSPLGCALTLCTIDRPSPRSLSSIELAAQHGDWLLNVVDAIVKYTRRRKMRILVIRRNYYCRPVASSEYAAENFAASN